MAIFWRNDGRAGVIRTSVVATLLVIAVSPAQPASTLDVKIGYIGRIEKTKIAAMITRKAAANCPVIDGPANAYR